MEHRVLPHTQLDLFCHAGIGGHIYIHVVLSECGSIMDFGTLYTTCIDCSFGWDCQCGWAWTNITSHVHVCCTCM